MFFCIEDDNGLAAGVYEVVWLIEDELVFGEAIIVGSGTTATIEVVNNTSIPLCVIQFNPNPSATWGLNEIDEPLLPGDSVFLEAGVGPVDGRIIDCDGDVRIEDSSGFLLDDDIVITVS